uniref:Rac GTPase-activating protein 1 n=1 Tax=Plectus sambesii TaxID=2011161 RepID=A0A914UZY2_9BILA
MVDKLSSEESTRLLLMFKEVTHYWRELSRGQEQECLALVDLLDKTRLKWLSAYNESDGVKQLLKANEDETQALRVKLKLTTEQLKDARAQIASLISAKQSVESDLGELERKFDLVRDLLKDEMANLPVENQRQLAFLKEERRHLGVRANGQSFSVLDGADDDIDYDKTGDSMDDEASFLRSGKNFRPSIGHHAASGQRVTVAKKRSRSKSNREPPIAEEEVFDGEARQPQKRSRENRSSGHEIVTTTTVAVDPSGQRPARARVSVRRSLNRSFSEPRDIGQLANVAATPTAAPRLMRQQQSQLAGGTMTPGRYHTGSFADLRSPAVATMVQSWTGGTSIDRRPHFFSHKTTLLREYCDVCAKRIGFGSATLKCADCRLTCHEHCRDRAPMPCVPRQGTPKTPGNQRPRLLEFCPTRPPMIPHIIIHCVVELERRGLGYVGIYRIPGSERQVADLLQKFKSTRGVPNLHDMDIEAITGCMKKFLQELREPLIPSTSWREFVDAAEENSEEKLYHAIADLPMPNRDTLAYLCAHWQRVGEMSEVNKMPLVNLARVLGPTVVGYSSPSTSDMSQAVEEMRKQSTVLMALLTMPHEYWMRYFTFDSTIPLVTSTSTHKSPIFSPELGDQSLLGPLRTPAARSHTASATPFATGSLKRDAKKTYFAQPWK